MAPVRRWRGREAVREGPGPRCLRCLAVSPPSARDSRAQDHQSGRGSSPLSVTKSVRLALPHASKRTPRGHEPRGVVLYGAAVRSRWAGRCGGGVGGVVVGAGWRVNSRRAETARQCSRTLRAGGWVMNPRGEKRPKTATDQDSGRTRRERRAGRDDGAPGRREGRDRGAAAGRSGGAGAPGQQMRVGGPERLAAAVGPELVADERPERQRRDHQVGDRVAVTGGHALGSRGRDDAVVLAEGGPPVPLMAPQAVAAVRRTGVAARRVSRSARARFGYPHALAREGPQPGAIALERSARRDRVPGELARIVDPGDQTRLARRRNDG